MHLYVCTWLSVPSSITDGDCVCNWAYACNGPSVCIWLSAFDCQCPYFTSCIKLYLVFLSIPSLPDCLSPSVPNFLYLAVCTELLVSNRMYSIWLLELVWAINPELIVRTACIWRYVPDCLHLNIFTWLSVPVCTYTWLSRHECLSVHDRFHLTVKPVRMYRSFRTNLLVPGFLKSPVCTWPSDSNFYVCSWPAEQIRSSWTPRIDQVNPGPECCSLTNPT